jgi:hypothetical protein
MRRLARRLFALCSAASLLLSVAVCVLWVRSYHELESLASESADCIFASGGGEVAVYVRTPLLAGHGEWDHFQWGYSGPAGSLLTMRMLPGDSRTVSGTLLGATLYLDQFGSPRVTTVAAILPHWVLFVLSAMLPAAYTVRRSVGQRRRLGFCLSCGYDLRASPERCPECGAWNPG